MKYTRSLLAVGSAINTGSFGLFAYDKQQAQLKQWRVPEKTLQITALCGGWIGGILAMEMFRHKTRKEPFRSYYFTCVAINAAGLAVLFSGNQQAMQILRQLMRRR